MKHGLKWLRIDGLLVLVAIASIFYFPLNSMTMIDGIQPQTVYDYRLRMRFDESQQEVAVRTYLPQSSARQQVFSISLQAPGLEQQRYSTSNGLVGAWRGDGSASTIDYQALVLAEAVSFQLDPDLSLVPEVLQYWPDSLAETDDIQVHHPEIATLWQQIKPQQSDALLPVLQTIYDYTAGLETLPFKGTTDALTALRLGAASCNGKSRLFVALARLNGIPARLVGGVILNDGKKRTSHQWLEVNIEQQWVPFDPTNGYFASLPAHYLELYVGDKALFTRTADINFDYFFDIHTKKISPALHTAFAEEQQTIRAPALSGLLQSLNMPATAAAILLSLPLCALVVTALRNVFGVKSFGVFMPMLVASACSLIGLWVGLLGLSAVVAVGVVCHRYFSQRNMLKIPRLAAVVTIVSAVTVAMLLLAKQLSTIQVGIISLFPVVIISFLADKLSDLVEEQHWGDLFESLLGTLLITVCCYVCIRSASVLGVLVVYPELFLVILAAQIYLGRWTGLRVCELMRFRTLIQSGADILGINRRNIEYVGALNSHQDLRTAVDKLATKTVLVAHNIPTPATIARFKQFSDVDQLAGHLQGLSQFVIKPNAGSQGKGIVVIREKQGEQWLAAGGKRFDQQHIAQHIREIINGNFAQHGQNDTAYLEPLIAQHPVLERFSGGGLCDIRIVIIHGKLVSAMLRIPTQASAGKANLHQGALGAAVDLQSGHISRCLLHGKELTAHPDNQQPLLGVEVPHWPKVIAMSKACSRAIGLGYLGVDICIDKEAGPLVLELNGRPGLEIQNVTQQSLITTAPARAALV